MTQTFVNSRLESIAKRFEEIDLLLECAIENREDELRYSTFCRSAHILLIAHFEGIVKDICKDIIDDINCNNTFNTVPKKIFRTYSNYFLVGDKKDYKDKQIHILNTKLSEAFGSSQSNMNFSPFIHTDNKNLAPAILEEILKRFGVDSFFWSLKNSELDIVFSNSKTETVELKTKLMEHINLNTVFYPYSVDKNIYSPETSHLTSKKEKILWEEFIDDVLKERHSIVHGQSLNYSYNDEELNIAKTKIEILICVFIINICTVSNPIIMDA